MLRPYVKAILCRMPHISVVAAAPHIPRRLCAVATLATDYATGNSGRHRSCNHAKPSMATTRAALALASLALVSSCALGKLLDSPPEKLLAVMPPQVVDSAAPGDASRVMTLVISAASQNALPEWTASHDTNAAWLTLGAPRGTVPDSFDIALDPPLTPGTYRDTITIDPTDGSADVRVPVVLRITEAP